MITEIYAKDFKGLSFTQPVSKKTLFLGPNGVGKSARSQALTLGLLGYIPGSGKTNDDILSSFGNTDVTVVGFTLDGAKFERAWGRVASGSVKEGFKLNGTKVGKEAFISGLGERGTPKIFDLSLFLDLSSQKQIDYVMALYPCGEDLTGVETMIAKQKESIKALEDKARSTEKASATLNASRAAMTLPAGSLAETTAAIEKAETDLEAANKELNEILAKNREEQVAEKAKTDERLRLEAEQKKKDAAAKAKDFENKKVIETQAQKIEELETKVAEVPAPQAEGTFTEWEKDGFKQILISILTTMDTAGCTVCAARLVVKKELKKIK
jgi:hypothetical protein